MKQEDYPEEILARLKFGKRRKPGQYEDDTNETMPLELIAVELPAKNCDDCGLLTQDRQVAIKKYQTPYAHWKIYCEACRKYKDPVSGEFCLTQQEILAHHRHQAKAVKQSENLNIDK